jgi:hypothetical protein
MSNWHDYNDAALSSLDPETEIVATDGNNRVRCQVRDLMSFGEAGVYQYRIFKQPVGSPVAGDPYHALWLVLDEAYKQASEGKGKERHSQGEPFEEQPMQAISKLVGSSAGMEFQAIKKIQESTRMAETDRRIHELLGAINYIAGTIIYLRSKK